jgi:hypothetical protein
MRTRNIPESFSSVLGSDFHQKTFSDLGDFGSDFHQKAFSNPFRHLILSDNCMLETDMSWNWYECRLKLIWGFRVVIRNSVLNQGLWMYELGISGCDSKFCVESVNEIRDLWMYELRMNEDLWMYEFCVEALRSSQASQCLHIVSSRRWRMYFPSFSKQRIWLSRAFWSLWGACEYSWGPI